MLSLFGHFKGRVDSGTSSAFVAIVETVTSFDRQRGWLAPLPRLPSKESSEEKLKGEGR